MMTRVGAVTDDARATTDRAALLEQVAVHARELVEVAHYCTVAECRTFMFPVGPGNRLRDAVDALENA